MATLSHTSFSSSSAAAEIRKLAESAFDFAAFKQETELLHLVLYRSRNQHHVSHWWRYFSMLHQHCFRIVNSYERLTHLRIRNSNSKPSNKKSGSSSSSNNNYNNNNKRSNNSGKNLKGYPDYSEGPVWAISKRIQDEAHYLYTKLIPSARLSFHGILRQGAFVTLGLALLGLAARLHALLEVVALVRVGGTQRKKIVERARKQAEREKQEIAAATQKLHEEKPDEKRSVVLDELDLGESISRDSVNLGTPISRSDADLGESVSRDELLKSVSSAAVSRESSTNPDYYMSTISSSTENKKEKTKKETNKKRPASSPSIDLDSLGMGLYGGVDSNSDILPPVFKKSKKSLGIKRDRESSSVGDKDKKKSKKKSKKNAIDSIFGF
jgi:hypothetical protein